MNWTLWRQFAAAAVVGGFGGSLATIFGVGLALTGRSSKPAQTLDWGFVWGTLIFFAIGAALTMILKEKDLVKALAIGMSIPATIKVNGSDVPTGIIKPLGSAAITFSMAAFAQPVTGKTLTLDNKTDLNGTLVWFIDPAGKQTSVDLTPLGSNPVIQIPDGSLAFAIQGKAGWSDTLALPANGGQNVTAIVDTRSLFSQSLRQAVGAPSGFYEIELK